MIRQRKGSGREGEGKVTTSSQYKYHANDAVNVDDNSQYHHVHHHQQQQQQQQQSATSSLIEDDDDHYYQLLSSRKTSSSLLFLLSLPYVAFVAWGVVLWFTVLAKHEECDMTWMNPTYLPVNTTSSSSSSNTKTTTSSTNNNSHSYYTLYQYRDDRDPRKNQQNHNDGGGASTSTIAVLFVPGHGGSYQQARSIGSHLTVKLTRKHVTRKQLWESQQSLLSAASTASSSLNTSTTKLLWDVFTVDFREEPTGLHGRLIQEQSDFLMESIQYLQETKKYAQVVLVAHSLGGYSSLLAMAAQSQSNQEEEGGRTTGTVVSLLLTLGTPLQHPVLTWDWTLRSIHRKLQQQQLQAQQQQQQQHSSHKNSQGSVSNNSSSSSPPLLVVSISGGLRDEMIPPSACQIISANAAAAPSTKTTTTHSDVSSLSSWMAVDIMKPVMDENKIPPVLGMDHRAIVWCHNLMEPVVQLLNDAAAFFVSSSNSVELSHPSSSSSSSSHNSSSSSSYVVETDTQQKFERLQYAVYDSLVNLHHQGQDQNHRSTSMHHGATAAAYTYSNSVHQQSATLRTLYGSLPAIAMETAALYNAEWLVNLVSCTALVHWSLCMTPLQTFTFPVQQNSFYKNNKKQSNFINTIVAALFIAVVLPLVVATLAWRSSMAHRHLSWISLWFLSGVAHAIFCGVRWLLEVMLCRAIISTRTQQHKQENLDHCSSYDYDGNTTTQTKLNSVSSRVNDNHKEEKPSSRIPTTTYVSSHVPLLATGLGMALSKYAAATSTTMDVLEIVLAVIALLGVYALAISLVRTTIPISLASSSPSSSMFQQDELSRIIVLLTWILPVLPVLVAGEVVLVVLRSRVNPTFWWVVLPFVFWLTSVQTYYYFCLNGTRRIVEQQQQRHSSTTTRGSSNSDSGWLQQRIHIPRGLLRVLAAAMCSDRLFRTLWTAADSWNYDAPLVYQVLVIILCMDLLLHHRIGI